MAFVQLKLLFCGHIRVFKYSKCFCIHIITEKPNKYFGLVWVCLILYKMLKARYGSDATSNYLIRLHTLEKSEGMNAKRYRHMYIHLFHKIYMMRHLMMKNFLIVLH